MLYTGEGFHRFALRLAMFAAVFCHASQALAGANPVGPAGVSAGPVLIIPTLGVETKYRDNIYLQENNETDSWIYLLKPTVSARAQDRNNIYQLEYEGEAGWYDQSSNDDDNDYLDNTFSGEAHMEFSERWIVEGYARWADLHEDRGTGLSEGIVGTFISEPIEYDQFDAGGSVQYGSDHGVGRLVLDVGYMEREYQNFSDLTRTRNRDETTLGLTFFYPLAPKTDALLEYAFKDVSYPNPFDNLPELDSQENSLWLGAEWEISENLTSTAKGGYLGKDFDSSGRKDWDGFGWSVELWIQPREQDTLFVQSSREPRETTLQGDFIKSESLLAQWTHDWSDRVYTKLSGRLGRDTYEESANGREDDIYNVSVKMGYEFRRWARAYAGYSYDDKDSSVDGLSYADNIFMIGVDLSL